MTSSWNRYHATEHQHVKLRHKLKKFRQTANIRSTKSQNINVFRLVLQLSLPKPSKPVVQSRMKIWLNQRRQAILQLHLRDHRFYCLLMWLILEVWRYGNTSPPVYATKKCKKCATDARLLYCCIHISNSYVYHSISIPRLYNIYSLAPWKFNIYAP